MSLLISGAGRSKRRLFIGVAASAALAASAAVAQARHPVHIAAGPLDSALLALAAQTHQQLIYAPDLVAHRAAPAVSGDLTAAQALAQLLAHTDIQVAHAADDVLVLRSAAGAPVPTAPEAAVPARPFGDQPVPTAATAPLPETPDATPAAAAPHRVAEVEVTGSHIRGASPAAPLLVISREDLVRTGQVTLADALRALPQNFPGGAGQGTVATGADKLGRNLTFAQGLNLRGLGNSATLVLVNGHRLGGSGAFGDFSDLSSIPTGSVERVEVLLDGASAIYGSDAVGGVVNIILRPDFDGAETRLLAGTGAGDAARQGQVSQTFGRRWAGGGVIVAYEGQWQEDLPDSARTFAASADLRPLGGSDWRILNSAPGNILKPDPVTGALVPGWAIPAGQPGVGLQPGDLQPGVVNLQNQRLGEDILPSQGLQSLYLAAHQDVGPRLRLSADARVSTRRFEAIQAAGLANLRVTRANPYFVSPNGTTSETIAYSFADDLPNPEQTGRAKTLSGALNADLDLPAGWRANGYATFARETDDILNRGVVHSLFLNEALGNTPDNPATAFSTATDGFFNPFGGEPGVNGPAVLDFIRQGFVRNHTRDEVASAGLQLDGTVWRLPGGDLKLAAGLQARREGFARSGSTFVSAVAPIPASTLDVHRTVEAAFLEAQAPLVGPANARPGLERLELSLAGRVEHYEAIGSTADPKVGVVWAPVRGLTVRATYGTSFRAPALREVDDAPLYSPTLLPLGLARVRTLILGGGNADLKPETATSWTAGVTWSPPGRGLKLSLDGYDIRFRNRIGQPALQNLAGALSDPTLASFVARISPTSDAADLARITALLSTPYVSTLNGVFQPTDFGAIVDTRYVNTAKLHVSGLDLTADYDRKVGDDDLRLTANGAYIFTFEQQVTPTSPIVDEVNLANFPVRFRGRAQGEWTRGPVTTALAVNYTSAYRDPLGPRIRSQTTVDLQVRVAPAEHGVRRGLDLTLNVRNLFDRAPPFYNSSSGYGFDASNADPIGRFVSLELTRRW